MFNFKSLFLTFLFLGVYFVDARGNNKIDSLFQLIKNEKIDTAKLKWIKQIGNNYTYSNPDSCISVFKLGVEISKKQKYLKGEAECYSGIARAYWVKGDYPSSTEFVHKALKIAEQINEYVLIARNFNMLGLLYMGENDKENAMLYFKKALHVENKHKDATYLSRILGNIGDIYLSNSDTTKAYEYYKKALYFSTLRKDDMNSSTNYLALGTIYREQKRYSSAEEYLNFALELALKVNDQQNAARSLSALSILYLYVDDFENCEKYALDAIITAKKVNDLPSIKEAAFTLHECLKKQNKFDEALTFYKISTNADDSMFNAEKNRQLVGLKNNFEIHKKQQQIEILNKEKSAAQLHTILLSIGFFLLLLLIIVVLKSRQKEIRAKKILSQQNDEIAAQRDEIENQRDKIIHQQKDIIDSIKYASRIQHAILPTSEILNKFVQDLFIFYKPKHIVSGDFYWFSQRNNWLLFAVADCTGHGVPGGFMSMLGISYLNEIVAKPEVDTSAKVLNQLRNYVIKSLQQEQISEESVAKNLGVTDGMDISFCALNLETNELHYAGANNSIYIVKKSDVSTLQEINSDKMPIGIHIRMDEFTNHIIKVEKGDVIYLMSDGFYDQFGGAKGKKFYSANLKKLILENSQLPLNEQSKIFQKTLQDWRYNHNQKYEQTDDITLVGVKI